MVKIDMILKILFLTFVILLMGNVYPNDVSFDVQKITMQPNSQDKIMAFVNINNKQTYNVKVYSSQYKDFKINFAKTFITNKSFSFPIGIYSKNPIPGRYPITIYIELQDGINKEILQKDFLVTIIPKQVVNYHTSPHTSVLPKIKAVFNKNVVVKHNKESFKLKISNIGSTTRITLFSYPVLKDVNILFDKSNFSLNMNETKFITVNIVSDENAKELNNIKLFARLLDGRVLDLGNINIHIIKSNISTKIDYKKDKIILTLKNNSFESDNIKIKGKTFSSDVYLLPNETKNIILPIEKIKVFTNDKLILETNDKNIIAITQINTIKNKSKDIAGLFSLSSFSSLGAFLGLIILILLIYVLFFSKLGLFGNTTLAKDIKNQ